MPSSRPTPERFIPPKGMRGSELPGGGGAEGGTAFGGFAVAVEIRPAGADGVAHALPALAVAVEVAVFELDPGAVGGYGGEGDGDLAGLRGVGLQFPLRVDVPGEDE